MKTHGIVRAEDIQQLEKYENEDRILGAGGGVKGVTARSRNIIKNSNSEWMQNTEVEAKAGCSSGSVLRSLQCGSKRRKRPLLEICSLLWYFYGISFLGKERVSAPSPSSKVLLWWWPASRMLFGGHSQKSYSGL